MSKLRVTSAFSGIGSYEKALKRLGTETEIINYIESDKYASKAYSVIHNVDESLNLGDITEVNTNKMDDFDLFVYNPPCQSWSAAGKQEGFADPRGTLFFDALRIIKDKKPKYAIMENVKNLTSKKFKSEFESMLHLLEEEGYVNYVPDNNVLNSREYGVPQNRERVFIVSIRKDVKQDFKFPEPVPLRFELKDALEEDAELPILRNVCGGFGETKARIFTDYSPTIRTSAGGGHIPSVVVKGCSLRTRSYMGQSQQLEVRKDDVSNAITTVPKDYMIAINGLEYTLEDLPKQYRVIDDYVIRQMSPLEAWRLMGFDDEAYYTVRDALNETFYKGKDRSRTQLYKLAGNSIVVDTLKHIFYELFKDTKYMKFL